MRLRFIPGGLRFASTVVAALALACAGPAWAAGTLANTTVTNTATLDYLVGAVAQTQVVASNSFIVDRRIQLSVTEPANATVQVVPGRTGAALTYLVTNSSNATIDISVAASQPVGGPAPHGGVDGFDASITGIFVDSNGNGVYDAGTDTAVTYLDQVLPDTSRTVFVVGTIPLSVTNGQIAKVTLLGQAREGNVAGSQGAVITETTGANTTGVDTVLADGAGDIDVARDGLASAGDDYTVVTAALAIAKLSRVVSDPQNGTTNPKMIPGATIQYCIVADNTTGAVAASGVAINDPLPTTTTYVASSVRINGTVTAGVCNTDGVAGGTFTAGSPNVVAGTLATVPAGAIRTLYFQATIN